MKKVVIAISALACWYGGVTLARAEATPAWYAIPSASYLKVDTDRATDNDLGASVAVGKYLSARASVELKIAGNQLSHQVHGIWRQRSLALDILCFTPRASSLRFYGVAALGMMRNRFEATHTESPYAELGAGMLYRLSEQGIAVRGDVRWRADRNDKTQLEQDGYTDAVMNLGVVFPIGGS